MADDQLTLFPQGQPGRGTAGEKTRPVASVPGDLTPRVVAGGGDRRASTAT